MRWWKWVLLVAGVIALALIGVCVWSLVEVTEERELMILEQDMIDDLGRPVVTGMARNDTGEKLGSVEAQVKWYGLGDVVLGTSFDFYFDSLQPGEIWLFEVRGWGVTFEALKRYELKVTGTIY